MWVLAFTLFDADICRCVFEGKNYLLYIVSEEIVQQKNVKVMQNFVIYHNACDSVACIHESNSQVCRAPYS